MGTISRKLPDSNPTRRAALKAAKQKKISSPIATDVLRATTITFIDAAQPNYETKCIAVDNALSVSAAANAAKDVVQADLHLYASHYIMVFNLAIRRNLIPKEERSRYGLDINSDALPPMDTEADLQQVAETIVTADAARVLAGGYGYGKSYSGRSSQPAHPVFNQADRCHRKERPVRHRSGNFK